MTGGSFRWSISIKLHSKQLCLKKLDVLKTDKLTLLDMVIVLFDVSAKLVQSRERKLICPIFSVQSRETSFM